MTAITVDHDQSLHSVFKKIASKRGTLLNPSYYQFRDYHENMENLESPERLLNYKDESNLNCLDMSIPVRDLPSRELLFVSKYFVDSPTNRHRQDQIDPGNMLLSLSSAIQVKKEQALMTSQVVVDEDVKDEDILLNEITATTYKVSISQLISRRNMKFIRPMSTE